MKINICLLLVMLFTVVFFGCASNEGATTNVSFDYQDVPSFYLSPPEASESIYGVGVAKNESLDISKELAISRAQSDISFQVGIQVQTSMVDYAQEIGEGANDTLIFFIITATRQIVNAPMLEGTTVEKLSTTKDGTVYALVSFSRENILAKAEEVFIQNEYSVFPNFNLQEALSRIDTQLENNPTYSVPVTR